MPDEYNALISALDAIDENESELDFEFIKPRVMQEEQRILMRVKSAQVKSETAALLSNQPKHSNRPTGKIAFSVDALIAITVNSKGTSSQDVGPSILILIQYTETLHLQSLH